MLIRHHRVDCVLLDVQAQIAVLEAAIEASAAKAAALKARAEQGEVAQGRLCLAAGAQAGGGGGGSSSNPGPAGAGAAAGQQGEDAGCAGGQVALEDLSKAVAAAYQRYVGTREESARVGGGRFSGAAGSAQPP